MNTIQRIRWSTKLADCDYGMAAAVLSQQFGETGARADLAEPLNRFLAHPCFNTAIPILERFPQLACLFEGCTRYGSVARLNRTHPEPLPEGAAREAALQALKKLSEQIASALGERDKAVQAVVETDKRRKGVIDGIIEAKRSLHWNDPLPPEHLNSYMEYCAEYAYNMSVLENCTNQLMGLLKRDAAVYLDAAEFNIVREGITDARAVHQHAEEMMQPLTQLYLSFAGRP